MFKTIRIKSTTATELCQIRNAEKENNVDVIKPMMQKVMTKDSKGNDVSFMTPFFSGNSFRGKLRRESFSMLMEKALEKNISMPNASNFHLMNAGGGNDFQTQSFETEQKVRDLNPVISLFGTSLAVAGKLVTPNLMPYRSIEEDNREYYMGETENGHIFSPIVTNQKNRDQFVKGDDIISGKGNARFLTEEMISAWEEEVAGSQKDRAAARADDSKEKVSKKAIQSFLLRDYVIRGVDFYTSLSAMSTKKLSDIEYGMLVKALERVVLDYLGSNSSKGFGRMEYTVDFGDGSEIETKVDAYGECKITKKNYKKDVKKAIKAWEDWLNNEFSEETFKVATLMK